MKKYHFLNINPSNMIVLKFHMFLVYIILSSNSFKTMFLGESKYQSYVYFQALKKANHVVFLRKFYSQHILISLYEPSNER